MKRQATQILSTEQPSQAQNNLVVSHWLPDEVLLTIFVLLKRGDLGACKKVSKTWERVANHPSLNWVLAVHFGVKQFEIELEVCFHCVSLCYCFALVFCLVTILSHAQVVDAVKKIKELHHSGKLRFVHNEPEAPQGQDLFNYNYRFRTRSRVQVRRCLSLVSSPFFVVVPDLPKWRSVCFCFVGASAQR
jgi:hypothetical protein